jgi:predicted O-linked N-acetylglucosamine transferase (SPINDLY family)
VLTDAIDTLRLACEADPSDPNGWSALAAEHFALGSIDAAESALRSGIAAIPESAQLHFNLGYLLRSSRRDREAEVAFERTCALDPADQQAWMQLGSLRYARADHRAAAAAFQQAAAINGPEQLLALRLAGFALADGGLPEAAAACLETVVSRCAGEEADLQLLSQLLFCRLELCDWHDRSELVARCRSLLSAGAVPAEPFTFLLLGEIAPAEQLELSQRFCRSLLPPQILAARQAVDEPKRRLRIGYLGDIFHEHATARLVTGMIEHHDHGRFEVHAFSYGPEDNGDKRRRWLAACDAFHDLSSLDVPQTAAYIHAQEIDILIDLNGWTGNTRSAALAWRPATVQINWLGYPATMGSRQLADYLIGDAVVTPPEDAALYAETLALMPHSYQPNDRSRKIGAIPSRRDAGLPEEGFVFSCFNRFLKISDEVFAAWCRILLQVPGSLLWLLDGDASARARLMACAAEHGIAAERLIFARHLPQEAHLARLSLADLVLDTFPYGAHTTASDALWCGVPVLTRAGATFSSRVAASLLQACDLPGLVVGDFDAYVRRAVTLARDPEAMAELRSRLARNRLQTPLFDTEAFARDFESLLWLIWSDHAAARGARPLIVGRET